MLLTAAHGRTCMKNLKYLTLNLVCLALIGWFALTVWQYQTTVTPFAGSDYITFYHALQGNRNIYENSSFTRPVKEKIIPGESITTTYARATTSLNLNTPLMSLYLKGLINFSNQLSIDTAIWTAATFAGAAIGFWMLLSFATPVSNIRTILPLFLALLICGFSLDNFYAGQVSFFIFPVLCLAFKFCYDKRPLGLAITLGILAAIKLFFLIFLIYYLAKKEWRPFLIMMLSFVISFFLPLLYFNSATYLHFFALTHQYSEFVLRSVKARNGSILGFISNLTYFLNSKITIGQLRYIAYGAVVYFLVRSAIYDRHVLQKLPAFSEELRFSFYIIIGLLCSPLAWIYYFVFLIVPIVVLFKVNQHYQLGKLFYFLVFFGLTLTSISYSAVSLEKTYWLLCLRQFCAFTTLLCWLIAFIIAASCIQQKKYRAENTYNMLLPLYVFASLIAVIYIQIACGKSYFLTWNKADYLESMKPTKEVITLKSAHKNATGESSKNPYNPLHAKTITQKNTD